MASFARVLTVLSLSVAAATAVAAPARPHLLPDGVKGLQIEDTADEVGSKLETAFSAAEWRCKSDTRFSDGVTECSARSERMSFGGHPVQHVTLYFVGQPGRLKKVRMLFKNVGGVVDDLTEKLVTLVGDRPETGTAGSCWIRSAVQSEALCLLRSPDQKHAVLELYDVRFELELDRVGRIERQKKLGM